MDFNSCIDQKVINDSNEFSDELFNNTYDLMTDDIKKTFCKIGFRVFVLFYRVLKK